MSSLGTWADHIVIQAVANANNLRIHIRESAANFSETSIVTSVYSGGNVRDIYIGHIDELHYVSTSPILQSTFQEVETQTNADKLLSEKSTGLKTTKQYMREYMKNRTLNNEFRIKENERKKIYNKKRKILKPRQSSNIATARYRQAHPEKVQETQKRQYIRRKLLNDHTETEVSEKKRLIASTGEQLRTDEDVQLQDSPKLRLLCISHVQNKFLIYVLPALEALITLNGYVVPVMQTQSQANFQLVQRQTK